MTDAEWDACDDPTPMLEFLRGKASDRKLRLFAVACCRRIPCLPTDDSSTAAIRVAEQFADGSASRQELRATLRRLVEVSRPIVSSTAYADRPGTEALARLSTVLCARAACMYTDDPRIAEPPDNAPLAVAAVHASDYAAQAIASTRTRTATPPTWRFDGYRGRQHDSRTVSFPSYRVADAACSDARTAELGEQARMLADVMGNPFRPPPPIDPAWLAWNDGVVRKLAQTVYDERAFDRLPLLADALEDAGCADADLLGHLRGAGPHCRGCWAVDALLNKA